MMILTELFVFSFSKDDPTNVFVLTYSLLLVRSNKATAIILTCTSIGSGTRDSFTFFKPFFVSNIYYNVIVDRGRAVGDGPLPHKAMLQSIIIFNK
jgi:hypothetical protein